MFKKITAVVLAVLMLMPIAALAASAAQEDSYDIGFAVATDLHYVHPLSDANARWSDTNPNMTFGSNGNLQNESGFIIDEFLRQCAEDDDCDFVFIPGDIVTYGRDRPTDHNDIAEKFKKFEETTGKQVYVINGNHDNGLDSATDSKRFKEVYHEFGYDTAFAVDETCCSYATELNDKYVLIALDSLNENYMLASGVDSARLSWVKEQAMHAKELGKYPIVIMHHNLLEHQPLELITNDKFIVSFPRTFASLFAEWGIKLVFSGHTHINDAEVFTSPTGKMIYEFCGGSLNEYPMNYLSFKLNDEKMVYSTKTIDSIDFEALTSVVKTGYTEHELDLLKNNFKQFVKEHYVGGIIKAVKGSITPEGLGIEEDSALYAPAKKITDNLNALLDKPIYGEDSIESAAAKYNVSIPESDYESAWEIAEELYEDIVTGDRKYDFDSPEIQIVLGAVETAIHMSASNITDSTLYAIAKAIATAAGVKLPANIVGSIEYLALAIVSPYLYDYINSNDGLNNLNGEIGGYGADTSRIENLTNAFNATGNRVIFYINMVLTLLKKSIEMYTGVAA